MTFKQSWDRLCLSARWALIQLLLLWVIRLIRVTDPDALPLLMGLGYYMDRLSILHPAKTAPSARSPKTVACPVCLGDTEPT
jgi:hypothetical protein